MRKEFGHYLRKLREEKGVSARRFALQLGMDASNFSKIERGEVPPPSETILARFAEALGIDTVVDDRWYTLKYHADVSRGDLPDDLMERDDVAALLPALFAHLRKEKAESFEDLYDMYYSLAAGQHKSTGKK